MQVEKEKRVIFHPGFGGSSEGNLILDDYISLAKKVNKTEYKAVFTFGPDDNASKDYISKNIDFEVELLDSKMSLYDFTKYISASSLFISTSTGPMHLAGATNTKTISFFGDSLFASSKRWATISEEKNQNNFMLNSSYTKEEYYKIENCLMDILNDK